MVRCTQNVTDIDEDANFPSKVKRSLRRSTRKPEQKGAREYLDHSDFYHHSDSRWV